MLFIKSISADGSYCPTSAKVSTELLPNFSQCLLFAFFLRLFFVNIVYGVSTDGCCLLNLFVVLEIAIYFVHSVVFGPANFSTNPILEL